jgi:hypothetical protein
MRPVAYRIMLAVNGCREFAQDNCTKFGVWRHTTFIVWHRLIGVRRAIIAGLSVIPGRNGQDALMTWRG